MDGLAAFVVRCEKRNWFCKISFARNANSKLSVTMAKLQATLFEHHKERNEKKGDFKLIYSFLAAVGEASSWHNLKLARSTYYIQETATQQRTTTKTHGKKRGNPVPVATYCVRQIVSCTCSISHTGKAVRPTCFVVLGVRSFYRPSFLFLSSIQPTRQPTYPPCSITVCLLLFCINRSVPFNYY